MQQNLVKKYGKRLDFTRLPKHIAIIMDGNGRWATKRGLPRNMGHKAGCENLKKIVSFVYDLGIPYITFFTFSTENWKRPKDEIDGIFESVRQYLNEDLNQFIEKDAKILTLGDLSALPEDIRKAIENAVDKTKDCKKFNVILAVNYGSKQEILRAVNLAVKQGKTLENCEEFDEFLYTSKLPDPDFVIRTSGEYRLSNFMLWQLAYSELYFTKIFWPSFKEKDLIKALEDFQGRSRRFGAVKN